MTAQAPDPPPGEAQASLPEAPHLESCRICGGPLEYGEQAVSCRCHVCGREEPAQVSCLRGHYVCETCHGAGFLELMAAYLAASDETSPSRLAEALLTLPGLPMLGCEHAFVAAGATMTALKNRGDAGVTQAHVDEALQRTGRQAVGAYCGLTGVCGVVPALGACVSVLVGAQCGKGPETRLTMELVGRLAAITAAEADPGCCKAYLRSCLGEFAAFVQERLHLALASPEIAVCADVARHPHGCRGAACAYHPGHGVPDPAATPSTPATIFVAAQVVAAAAGG
jgi:hypothetical protein